MSSPLGYSSDLDPPIESEDPTQQSLRDRQLRMLFEIALDAIAILDDRGRYLDVNPAACQLFGLQRDELLGRCISEFAEPGYDFPAAWQEFLQQEKARGDFRLVRTDGEIRIVEYAATANFLPDRHLSVMRDVTERKQAQAQVEKLTRQLAQTQAKLQEAGIEPPCITTPSESNPLEQIARHIPGVIYQFRMRPDGTFHFPYASEGVREIYGVSPEEVREDTSKVFAIIHSEDLDRLNQSILESAEHLTPWYCEYRVCLPDGRMLWLVGDATPQREPDGSTLWHGYIRDITDSKKAEAYNQRLLAILESTSDLVGTADLTGKALYLNQAWRNLFDNNEDTIANVEISTSHPKWALDIIFNQGLPEAARSGIWRGETAIVDRTGHEVPVSQVILAHKSAEGKVEYFSTILRDITESKVTELALRNSLKQLSDIKFALDRAALKLIETTQLQQAILDSANYTIISTDTNGIIKTFNAAAQRLLGYSSAEVVDKLTPAIIHDFEEIKQRATELTAELGQPITPGFEVFVAKARLGIVDEYEWSYIRKDGSRFPVQLSVTALRDRDGKITGFLGIGQDITDRKEAEKKLRQNELKYHQILDAITDMVLVKGPQSRIVWANKAFRDYYGLTNDELKDMIDAPFNEPDYTLQYIRDDAYVFETGQSLEIEEPVTRYDGKVQIFNTIKSVIRNETGEKILTVGVSRDISDRKCAEVELIQAQAELKEAEKFLRSIYEGVGCLIFVVDVTENREILYSGWSLSAEKATATAAADIIGKTPEFVFGLTEGAAVRQKYLRCIESGTSITYEECIILNDRATWCLTTLNPIKNSENKISRIVGTSIDISDRKRQEQALLLIVEGTAAKTGEEFFKSCVQYLAQVLQVRYASIAEFVDAEKSIAKTLAFWAGDDFADNFTYNLAGTPCKNVASNIEVCRYENSVQRLFPEDDYLVDLQAESYAGLSIIDADGNHLGLLAVLDTKPMVRDLEMQSAILRIFATRAGAELERIKAEAAVRKSEIQLRLQSEELEKTIKKLQNTQTQLIQAEKMSSLGQLVAGIAHEINNPVSFIYSNIQPAADYANDLIKLIHLYQKHYHNPPQAIANLTEDMDFDYLVNDFSKLLESMKNGATRIRDIVKSLRTFSRLDEADLKEIDIHENIESTLEILQNRLNGRAVKPEINVTKNYGKLPPIECYGGLLNQVFMNLLVNAIDAIEQRRQSLENTEKLDYIGTIAITTCITSEDLVTISIHDNGCGMATQVKEKIFNPFFTTKPVGKGTGMGLAISYQIITENHQGHLQCFSTLGKGTEFRIELPVRNHQ
ncbi:MAG TPA: PAS domain S-box protein [Leptolyngbyaceae cyanobacterium]